MRNPSVQDEVIDTNFGRYLKKIREEKNVNIATLANKTGIKYHRLQALEIGAAPTGITKKECDLIAAVLEIEPYILITKAIGSELVYN